MLNISIEFEKDKYSSINLNSNSMSTIEDIIKQSIFEFNKNFETSQYGFRLTLDVEKYKIKAAKKNGKAKSDLPSKIYI